MSFITTLTIVSQLLPVVSGLVKTVEAELEGAAGALKLTTVQTGLESAFNALGNVEATFVEVWPYLSGLVEGLVAVYTASGLFTHASTAIDTGVGAVIGLGNTLAGIPAPAVKTLVPAPPSPTSLAAASQSLSSGS